MSYNWIYDYEATHDFWMIRLEQKNEDIQLPGKKVAGTTDKSAQDEWKRLHVPNSDSVAMTPTSTIPMLHLTGFDSEMCWIAEDGSVFGAYLRKEHFPPPPKKSWASWPWSRYTISGQGSAAKGGITAVAMTLKMFRVFWIGPKGTIELAEIDCGGKGCKRYTLFKNESVAHPGGSIVAIRPTKLNVMIYWVGSKGSIWKAQRQDNDSNEWIARSEFTNEDTISLTGSILALCLAAPIKGWRVSNDENEAKSGPYVFYIDFEGAVHEWYMEDGYGMVQTVAEAGSAAVNSRLAWASSCTRNIEIFFITPSGGVECRWRNENETRPLIRGSWRAMSVAPKHSARVDSGIAAMKSMPSRVTNVFWVGPDNSLQNAWIDALDRDVRSDWATDSELVWRRSTLDDADSVFAGSPLGIHQESNGYTLCYRAKGEGLKLT